MIENFAKSRANKGHFLLANIVTFLWHSTGQWKQSFWELGVGTST